MSIEEYWMGKNIDLDGLWKDFDDGSGYIRKVSVSELYLLRMTFAEHPPHLPLFDHEAIYKTVKGTFHDVKAECLTPQAYDEAAPVFLYRVDRGSGIFEFLAPFDPLMTWIVALGGAAMWYRKALHMDHELDEKRLTFIQSCFPRATNADVIAYMKAWTTFGRRRVLHRLISQGLHRIEVSREPIPPADTTIAAQKPPVMIDMESVISLPSKTNNP